LPLICSLRQRERDVVGVAYISVALNIVMGASTNLHSLGQCVNQALLTDALGPVLLRSRSFGIPSWLSARSCEYSEYPVTHRPPAWLTHLHWLLCMSP
jgi:hypothetical protein